MTGPGAPRRSPNTAGESGAPSGVPPASAASRSARQLEDRIAELEQRLLELEGRRPSMEATRTYFRQMFPAEAGLHFRTAAREQLLGVRVLVDHWIKRVDPEDRSSPRETIPIE